MTSATELSPMGAAVAVAAPTRRERRDWFLFFLSLPALIVVFLVIGLPLVYSLVLSLHRINLLTHRWVFVGLQNYVTVLPQPDFLWAFARTAYFAGLTVVGGLLLGTGMALILNMNFWGRGVLRSVVLLPWAMAPVAVGILWGWIFDGSHGALNGLLMDLGITRQPIYWFGNGALAFNLVALVHVWNQAPLAALLILAGLQSMPENLHKAAKIDGAGAFSRFWHITLPWLKPTLLLLLILTTINSIMAFDLFWTMTKGGPGSATTVFSWMGYSVAFLFLRFAEGAAILYILTIVCLLFAWLYLRLLFPRAKSMRAIVGAAAADGSESNAIGYQFAGGPKPIARQVGQAKLTRLPPFERKSAIPPVLRRPMGHFSLAVAAALIFAWSVVPFAWLVVMSMQHSADLVRAPPTIIPGPITFENYRLVLFPHGVADGQSSVQATRVPLSIVNSLIVAVCVTAVNLVLGSLAGYAYSRSSRSKLMKGALWSLMLIRMTPSLALILPFFLVFKTLDLIDTRTALVIAYCSLILPLAVWMMKAHFDGLPPNLEKAALVDGCTRLQAFWKIVLPVSRPAIVATAIFCFLVSWNEFIFALILTGTPAAQTIPVIISGFLVQLRFYDYGPMFAASVIAVIPPVVIALAFQRYLVRGMLAGSIKG